MVPESDSGMMGLPDMKQELVSQASRERTGAWDLTGVKACARVARKCTRFLAGCTCGVVASKPELLPAADEVVARAEGQGVAKHEPAYRDLAGDGKALHHC